MGKKSRTKGATGEREWASYINDIFGSDYHRTPLSGGLDIKGDIRRTYGSKRTIIDDFHWEIKRVEALNIHKAMEQSIRDSKSSIPLVVHRRNNDEWKVTMLGKDFLGLMLELEELRLFRKGTQ